MHSAATSPVMSIPRPGFARSARLASLPLAAAGRAAASAGHRIGGRSREQVNQEFAKATAEQLFAVLGHLKGGALKFGQVLSVLEAGLPEEFAEPYRDALVKMQNAVEPMAWNAAERVLTREFGHSWRQRFREFDESPVAAASIGQVHRAVWHDGRAAAVKIQYPGVDRALMADYQHLAMFARLGGGLLFPGVDVKPLLAELKERLLEELDYRIEADHQRIFARTFVDDPSICVPAVLASAPRVLVSEWMDGTPLSTIATVGSQEDRDRAGHNLTLLHFSAPARCGLLHADPHPGNFLCLPDGRLGVLDFGAVAPFPQGMPFSLGRFLRVILDDDRAAVDALMRSEGFVRRGACIDLDHVVDFFAPIVEPLASEQYQFTRLWLQRHARRLTDRSSGVSQLARSMTLPADYAVIHRVTLGSLAMVCQLDATASYRGLATTWLPGFG